MKTSDVEEIRDLREENFKDEGNRMEYQLYLHNFQNVPQFSGMSHVPSFIHSKVMATNSNSGTDMQVIDQLGDRNFNQQNTFNNLKEIYVMHLHLTMKPNPY